jgi:hypothetical protein
MGVTGQETKNPTTVPQYLELLLFASLALILGVVILVIAGFIINPKLMAKA